ncbi:hypothetical protein F5888DRAFT_1908864 [Russula emetica]|nr:hypothetical protein F5888DRAFT_1908864 [Russula emetica]
MLSIVVNSAGCERVFSHFGITHTKHRSRLSLEKVQKTAIVKMDLQHSHVEAGLIHRRCKRKFGAAFEEDSTSPIAASAPPSTSASRDIGNAEEHEVEGEDDEEDVVDFEGLAEKLISAAEADDEDNNESETTTPVPQNSSSTKSTSGPNTSRKILIPLKDLFIYPGDPAAPTELEFYWKGGIAKLEETLAAYELLLESPRHSDNEAA